MSEDDLLRAIVDLCNWRRLRVYHVRRSDKGVVTERGFPDLVIVGKRTVFAELKSQMGKIRPEQVAWIDALRTAGSEVYLWRPSDMPEIQKVLASLH